MVDIAVLDFGSSTLRAGWTYSFPSEEEPRVQTPCELEVHATAAAGAAQNGNNTSSSSAAMAAAHLQPRVVHPVQRGQICHLDGLEALTHHVLYTALGWEMGREGSVVVAEPLLTPRRHRELLAQCMFEVFNLEGLYVQDSASLALCALGKLTGCVIDIGHGKVDVATVTDGQVCVRGRLLRQPRAHGVRQ
jgi:actin-related protein 7